MSESTSIIGKLECLPQFVKVEVVGIHSHKLGLGGSDRVGLLNVLNGCVIFDELKDVSGRLFGENLQPTGNILMGWMNGPKDGSPSQLIALAGAEKDKFFTAMALQAKTLI